MILLDTHVWVSWVHNERMRERMRETLEAVNDTFGVSAISCWEVAKLVERGRLAVPAVFPVSSELRRRASGRER